MTAKSECYRNAAMVTSVRVHRLLDRRRPQGDADHDTGRPGDQEGDRLGDVLGQQDLRIRAERPLGLLQHLRPDLGEQLGADRPRFDQGSLTWCTAATAWSAWVMSASTSAVPPAAVMLLDAVPFSLYNPTTGLRWSRCC
ncbi:hypothetical protein ACIA5G_45880 [Amycolatopsis sp. NPDC051758]|uniref:hypothetical protein n=1 Tax=Amycolatopsis sp. NPDC051758 TaxID=3363935 RepID=UPI0037A64EB5